jgi:hypothetical protein
VRTSGAQRAATALALVSLLVAQTLVLFVRPPDPVFTHVDAVVIPLPGDPLKEAATGILEAGLADALVVVRWRDDLDRPLAVCDRPQAYPVHCVVVDRAQPPGGTRAQIGALSRAARTAGFRSLVIVAPSYKVVRTRLLAGRCHDGPVDVVGVTDRNPAEILREWPALLYALARPGC